MATDSWKDRLTSYNGSTITYDSIGNPLTYNNGSAYTFTWEGRQMQTATKGNTTWTYTYNADGLRTGKTNGTTTYTYTWNGNRQLSSMVCGTSSAWFYYDHEGKPLYMEYADGNDECSGIYRYILNLQGDVVGLYDLTRDCMAMTYTYDAWGRELSWATLNSGYAGLIFNNPLTYRGYIYDRETGFYYLQSRYYDPSVGRFLNADDTNYLGASGTLLGWNLFSYCGNDAINQSDNSGNVGTPLQWVCAIIGGVAGWFFGDYVARSIGLFDGKWYQWQTYAYWAVRGLVVAGGAILGYVAAGALIKILTSFLTANPTILARMPFFVKWFLGITGSARAVRSTEVLEMARMMVGKVGTLFRSFSAGNFRYNLQQLTGNSGAGLQAHHVLPQKFEGYFSKLGLDIHNPIFGAWVDSTHQSWSAEYNRAWELFFATTHNPTVQQVLNKAVELAKKYGFKLNF